MIRVSPAMRIKAELNLESRILIVSCEIGKGRYLGIEIEYREMYLNKRDFIIEKQITRHFVFASNIYQTSFPSMQFK